MFIFTKGISKLPVLLVAMLTLFALSVACSGETVTVVQTVVVEKEVVVAKEDIHTDVDEKEVKGDTVVQTVVVPATTGPSVAVAPVRTDDRFGGELTVALGAAISTLDVHRTTGTTANTIAYAVQEFLFA